MFRRTLGAGAAAGLWASCSGLALADTDSLSELRALSIEQLASIEITSVSRRPEAAGQAAASVEVITRDDIRRSGAQSLPEALRLARNLEVARVDSMRYAISARGFNSFQSANKLLVLIDGRSVYTPLYSGVFWDQQHVPLQDIERIEVISGPGGTLWGANAVNGVINIITARSQSTRGLAAELFAGSNDQRVDVRYGGGVGENGAYRLYLSGFSRGSMLTVAGDEAGDEWAGVNGGFRADWGGAGGEFMVQGALYNDEVDAGGTFEGGHLLGRWRRELGENGAFEVQAYYAQAAREGTSIWDSLDTWDISFHHNLQLGDAHRLVWGGGYRVADSEFRNALNFFNFADPSRTLHTASLFVQDEIALQQNVALTLGVKLEDHTFTELEYMPNVRLAWRLSEHQMIWGAVSRAVRTPSRIDRELEAPGILVAGDFESEDLIAYELGYRGRVSPAASLSATLYVHDYERLRSSTFTLPLAFPVRVDNDLEGEVYGLELASDVAVTPDWRLALGATLMNSDFRVAPNALDANGSGDDPGYQLFVRSHADLSNRLRLDVDLRAIDEIRPEVDSYVELGARLGWQVNENVEVALSGANLLHDQHAESLDGTLLETPRTIQFSAHLTY